MAIITANGAYFGASAGYMIDNEEEIIAIQLGMAVSESEAVSHNLEVEIAYMESSMSIAESFDGMTVSGGGSFDISPIMVNYLFKSKPEKSVSFYGGAGIGYSFWDLSAWATDGSLSWSFEDSGETLTWQLLAGVQFALSQTVNLRLGYRYVYMDDVSVVIEGEEISDSLDDSVIEIGVVFSF